jgi:NAD(P)-dependent dehydrogenase (short-subunit alcohol dehydrogenase family)
METTMGVPIWLRTGGVNGIPSAKRNSAGPFPHTAIVAALDSTKPADIARIVREAKDRFGSVDVLVNTAGVGYIPAVEEGNREGISRQIHINFSDLTAT